MLDHMRHPQQTWLCKVSDCWSEKRGGSWRETLKWLDLPEGCIMLCVKCTERQFFFFSMSRKPLLAVAVKLYQATCMLLLFWAKNALVDVL